MPTAPASDRTRRAHSAFLVVLPLLAGLTFQPLSAFAQEESAHFEIGPVFAQYHAPALTKAVTDQFALGGRFTWNWLPHLSLEAEYASTLREPKEETQVDGGYFSQALFGVKSGIRWKHWGLFAKFRPGLISYSGVVTSANTNGSSPPFTLGRLNDAVYDVGGGAEFLISRRWLFRYDASDLISHQGRHNFLLNGQKITFLPLTYNNFEAQVSVAFRF